MRTEIRLAGFGGQGIARAGYMLGKAVAVGDGNEAVFTQEYGPESRGGASAANIVVSDEPIDEPFVALPDILVAMYQAAFDKYAPKIAADARVVIDSDLVEPHDLPEGAEVLTIPATRIAEELGVKIAANVVMLGFLAAVADDIVSAESLRDAVRGGVPARVLDRNLEAFERGHRHGFERDDRGGDGDA
ncbi:MAG: pyruvate ferredoxin oxidoreductase [Acidobacteria bacterium]|nr:pyruvate ferredoxin oxidoreductase [Acidobacteriota bacterium]NIM60849.1 pyruvate ferredoxin oxidoreductase [Acidobacteriota bacterium]NIO58697.1 pyruvate ferredoxin oxidoreductase [Acidobacteriota bacterium]NIQ29753.1 pyruvate ferredoxin oxidoreductase [Acidobacteriota bacterium]NIQ87037.1 pyruvate ferredoxin oxidoreductase [Acidobacteriota bacterium]